MFNLVSKLLLSVKSTKGHPHPSSKKGRSYLFSHIEQRSFMFISCLAFSFSLFACGVKKAEATPDNGLHCPFQEHERTESPVKGMPRTVKNVVGVVAEQVCCYMNAYWACLIQKLPRTVYTITFIPHGALKCTGREDYEWSSESIPLRKRRCKADDWVHMGPQTVPFIRLHRYAIGHPRISQGLRGFLFLQ